MEVSNMQTSDYVIIAGALVVAIVAGYALYRTYNIRPEDIKPANGA